MSGALRAHLARVAAEARALGRPLLAVWREPAPTARDPLAGFAAADRAERFFWSQPAPGIALAAHGAVACIETRGADRFRAATEAARALFADVRFAAAPGAAAALPEAGAVLVGSFAFADEVPSSGVWAGWPALRFVLPRRCLVQAHGAAWMVWAVRVAPDADPDTLAKALRDDALPVRAAAPAEAPARPGFAVRAGDAPEAYRARVAAALAAIARGGFEKVVLARTCRVARPEDFDPIRVLRSLCAEHPDCTVFAVGAGERTFVGATPERLLRRTGTQVLASALAGSAPRGRTPEEDARLAQALRESKKEQAEHAAVRRAIADALAPVCASLAAPEAPALLRLGGIQHLHTPFAGTLRPDVEGHLLALAGRLHPTPAVGGAPPAAARAFLAAHEGFERCGYAGGVGWIGAGGEGELAVALRCALLHGRRATLFAGAGIVEGSDPDAELAETRLKLRAALCSLVEL